MAKLGSFYSLCPLIDNKGILDVSNDREEGVVIVTLGKNIASRYKVSNQKQITCWRTKEKFSSPVLYDKQKNQYVAVFNQTHIKFWNLDDSLDKLKKYKFTKPIHTILNVGKNYLILFQNGYLHDLDDAIENRKSLIPPSTDVTQIDHVLCESMNEHIYIGLITGNNFYWTIYTGGSPKYSKIELSRDGLDVRGRMFHAMGNVLYLFTLWSDGSIFAKSLENENSSENDLGELYTIVDSVSSKHFVAMISLDENYIGLYGANTNEEGAMLAIYNLQFKVTQSKQPFKLFTTNTKIWKQENSILLPVGQNLAVVPFHLETEQLAALVGSHKELQNNLDADIKIVHELDITSWDGKQLKSNLPADLKTKLEQYMNQGLSENIIFEELLPEMIKQKDLDLLYLLLRNFSDIHEKYLVQILNYALEIKNSKLINTIIARSFSEVLILPYLRSDLSTDKVLELLEHIQSSWSKDIPLKGLNFVETHTKFLEWSCVLIDANYQKIVLSKDKVFLEMLSKIDELVKNYLESLNDLKAVEPLLSNFKKKKTVNRCTNVDNLRYSIEQISLY
ncbi:nucleolar protein 11 [Diabrotica virgifera virgifera]|uniref:Nucleolar protein 11 n=1 Tax=Diabrotica virgifera virgifera TaxID=50390 RepID=A0A6P7F6X3_DIAVI|nr:nucleolar protein 11 [Diabrotica virgifera virgifera]